MAPKSKRVKAQSLKDFVGQENFDDDNLDWAIAGPTEEAAAAAGPAGAGGKGNLGERKDFSVKPGDIKNFRDLPQERPDSFVDPNMKPPFLAFVANLPFSLTAEEIKKAFEAETGLDSVANVKVCNKGVAFVEFKSVDNLQAGVLASGKNVNGRPIKVLAATDEQKADKRNFGSSSGGGAKQGSGGGGAATTWAVGRDDMGAAQPSFNSSNSHASSGGDREGLSRNLLGSAQQPDRGMMGGGHFPPPPPADLSRDSLFGSREQRPMRSPNSVGGSASAGSPVSAGGPPASFGDWRNTEPVKPAAVAEVPPASPVGDAAGKPGRDGGRPARGGAAAGTGGAGTWRASATPAIPEGGSWRDTAPVSQPAPPRGVSGDEQTPSTAPPKKPAAAVAPAATAPAASWRDTAPEKPAPKKVIARPAA